MERANRDSGREAPGPQTSDRPIAGRPRPEKPSAAASEARSQRERVVLSLLLCPAREEDQAA
jgi:hypothetical protein